MKGRTIDQSERGRWIIDYSRPQVIGTVHTLGGVRLVSSLTQRELEAMLDAIELRLDVFRHIPMHFKKKSSLVPVLFTARDGAEGGVGKLEFDERRVLLESALPFASGIDVELRNAERYQALLKTAEVDGVVRILSFHDFMKTPKLGQLLVLEEQAFAANASLLKVATFVQSAGDLAILLEFLDRVEHPVAVMGMGPLGRASRIALAAAGSCLNYGWLDRPQVPGQFSAMALKQRIWEVWQR